jgi:hypothetical protein
MYLTRLVKADVSTSLYSLRISWTALLLAGKRKREPGSLCPPLPFATWLKLAHGMESLCAHRQISPISLIPY